MPDTYFFFFFAQVKAPKIFTNGYVIFNLTAMLITRSVCLNYGPANSCLFNVGAYVNFEPQTSSQWSFIFPKRFIVCLFGPVKKKVKKDRFCFYLKFNENILVTNMK